MELTKAEQIKLGSFKEHLASLKTELEVANRELESVLSARNLAKQLFEQESLRYKNELSIANKELSESLSRKIETDKYVLNEKNSWANYVAITEAELAEKELAACDRVKWYEFKLQELKEQQKALKGSCDSLIERQLTLSNECSKYAEKKEKLVKEEKEISLLVTVKKSELDEIISDIERSKVKFKEAETESLGRLKELEREVELEKSKIAQPMKTLREEQEKFQEWENNVRIIYLRTKKAWEVLHPGQNLDNVIKV